MADQSEVERMREDFLRYWADADNAAARAFCTDLDALLAAVRREERERCAKVVDDFNFPSTGTLLGDVEEACKRSPDDWLNAAAAALRASQEGEG